MKLAMKATTCRTRMHGVTSRRQELPWTQTYGKAGYNSKNPNSRSNVCIMHHIGLYQYLTPTANGPIATLPCFGTSMLDQALETAAERNINEVANTKQQIRHFQSKLLTYTVKCFQIRVRVPTPTSTPISAATASRLLLSATSKFHEELHSWTAELGSQ